MPDDRLTRARRTLPHGYQFGDARWRPLHENAAEQLARRGEPGPPLRLFLGDVLDPHQWNVIEGEP